MASVQSALMTVEEFRRLPKGPEALELHQGELIKMTRPKHQHFFLQRRLRELLGAMAPAGAIVDTEFPFRPRENDIRAADVAYVSGAKWAEILPDDNLRGSPELVVEVLSPSNTAAEMYEKEQLCLSTGCQEFWVVDPKRRQLRVSTADGKMAYHGPGQAIPLTVLGGGEIAVDAIFS